MLTQSEALGNWSLYLPKPPFDKNSPFHGYPIGLIDGILILHLYFKSDKLMAQSEYDIVFQ